MREGFVITVLALAAMVVVAYSNAAQAGGTTQKGSWEGQSESFSGVILNQSESGTSSTVDAPDMGKRVPDVIPPSFPTAYECGKGVSGGFGVAGFGASGGGVVESEECNARADAAYAAKLGDHITAREIMCAKERYYLANKRSQQIYASQNRPYVDNNGLPLSCFLNEDYDVVYRDDRNAKQARNSDMHHGAFAWQNWED